MNKMLILSAVLVVLWSIPACSAQSDDAKTNTLGQIYDVYLPGHAEINGTIVGPFFYYDQHILHVASDTTVKVEFSCKDNAYYPIEIVSGGRHGYLFCPGVINYSQFLPAGNYRITVGWMGGDWGNVNYSATYDG